MDRNEFLDLLSPGVDGPCDCLPGECLGLGAGDSPFAGLFQAMLDMEQKQFEQERAAVVTQLADTLNALAVASAITAELIAETFGAQ